MEETLEGILTCAICLGRLQDPRLLPCQHTFCFQPCLTRVYDRTTERLKCPLCRYEVKWLPDLNRLPRNRTIYNLLEIAALGNKKVSKPTSSVHNLDSQPAAGSGSTEVVSAFPSGGGAASSSSSSLSKCNSCSQSGSAVNLLPDLCPHCCEIVCSHCQIVHAQEVYFYLQSNVNTRLQRVWDQIERLNQINSSRLETLDASIMDTRCAIQDTFDRIADTLERRKCTLLNQLDLAQMSIQQSLIESAEDIHNRVGELASMQQHYSQLVSNLPINTADSDPSMLKEAVTLRNHLRQFLRSQEKYVNERERSISLNSSRSNAILECPQFHCSEDTMHAIIATLGNLEVSSNSSEDLDDGIDLPMSSSYASMAGYAPSPMLDSSVDDYFYSRHRHFLPRLSSPGLRRTSLTSASFSRPTHREMDRLDARHRMFESNLFINSGSPFMPLPGSSSSLLRESSSSSSSRPGRVLTTIRTNNPSTGVTTRHIISSSTARIPGIVAESMPESPAVIVSSEEAVSRDSSLRAESRQSSRRGNDTPVLVSSPAEGANSEPAGQADVIQRQCSTKENENPTNES